jgi:hypothetical protein
VPCFRGETRYSRSQDGRKRYSLWRGLAPGRPHGATCSAKVGPSPGSPRSPGSTGTPSIATCERPAPSSIGKRGSRSICLSSFHSTVASRSLLRPRARTSTPAARYPTARTTIARHARSLGRTGNPCCSGLIPSRRTHQLGSGPKDGRHRLEAGQSGQCPGNLAANETARPSEQGRADSAACAIACEAIARRVDGSTGVSQDATLVDYGRLVEAVRRAGYHRGCGVRFRRRAEQESRHE